MAFSREDKRGEEVVDSQYFVSQVSSSVIDTGSEPQTDQEIRKLLSDKESKIIDTLRTQYKHNDIPDELVRFVEAWGNLSEEMKKAITLMTSI